MTAMNSSELRKQFLDFFASRGHAAVPSASLVPADDPSLLFTGAGMNQFKPYFLGLKRDMRRAASCQKCFRTGDVEQVGRTASHLTFFEMLGNFSFGDYFKKEACLWAWEFMTGRLKIPPDRLWATVYEQDEEAAAVWRKEVGLPTERILRMGAKDNFWPSNAPTEGPNGPCGPCSELHYDYGCCTVGKKCPDPENCKPGCPCGRFVEVWNLVFTQFDRQPDGALKPLPAPNIDTGMGLERLTAVMQGKMSVFETDLFAPIVEEIAAICSSASSSRKRGSDSPFRGNDPPVAVRQAHRDRVSGVYAIADHVRALTFLIGDGVAPSNDGRGYVLRMLLRKAARAGMGLGLKRPFLYRLSPVVVGIMKEAYPELAHARESIAKVIQTEEERFQQMLQEKIPLLRQEIRAVRPEHVEGRTVTLQPAQRDRTAVSAETAARFYDTHGLSYEEIAEVCAEEKILPPSREEFEEALTELQAGSKQASGFSGAIFSPDSVAELVSGIRQPTEFTGYAGLVEKKAKVLAIIRENCLVEQAKAPAKVGMILDRSPFYGEAGGQVGDTGLLEGSSGRVRVLDTQRVGSVLIHEGELQQGSIRTGEPVRCEVDAGRRQQVAQNHTATHLLHAALRKVLGPHVMQAGSRVAPDHLRLDFSHGQRLSAGQRDSVESLANEWVGRDFPVRVETMALEEARKVGAMALFGEKYGAQVRVVSIGEVSKELCGGTHLKGSGEVRFLTIVEEGSIASGVRRVEALCAGAALDSLKAQVLHLEEERDRLLRQNRQLEQERNALKVRGAA